MTNPHPSHMPLEPALCQPLRREYLQGATYKALAEKYQIDQRTAKRYVQNNLPLEGYNSLLSLEMPLSEAMYYALILRELLPTKRPEHCKSTLTS